ncbi:hypothetical protein F4780DRAFT_79957 [Xylariomycetidae sp. FL0641]|nr:hypothetical protein F4780DRAFT_79957 [Xylariomycetidae sp. FL0641]
MESYAVKAEPSGSDRHSNDNKSAPLTSTHPTTAPQTRYDPTLRYRKTPIFLLILYLPTLIVPWVLICVMRYRPLGAPSYFAQTGTHYIHNYTGMIIANLLGTINAVLAVPIISTLLAYAAVVYSMRRKHDQELSVQQLFVLADKGWANISLLWHTASHGKGSGLLWTGAALIIVAAILQPLTSVLVTYEQTAATSCIDLPFPDYKCNYGQSRSMTVGWDPEPADMPLIQPDLVLQDIVGRLTTISDGEVMSNLWPVNTTVSDDYYNGYSTPPDRRKFLTYSADMDDAPGGFFVTALENGTNTGVLRQHAIRLNSSIQCEYISQADFPSPCPGARPMETHVERPDLKLDVCAPGNWSEFPFTISRDRQDISESLYLKLEVSSELASLADADNFTLSCIASTSRGYFELGNERNGFVYGPLLDKWPQPEDIGKNFQDWKDAFGGYNHSQAEDPSAYGDGYLPLSQSTIYPFGVEDYASVPGPLMVSAAALFGNYSFVQIAADNSTNMTAASAYAAICEHGSIPFSQLRGIGVFNDGPEAFCYDAARTALDTSDSEGYVSRIIASHASTFGNKADAEYALTVSMYLANHAVLTQTTLGEDTTFNGGRPIYASPGTPTWRPVMAPASLIVLSILLGLQVIGLLAISVYTYKLPTWTPTLDSLAISRIAKAVPDNDLPPLGPVTRQHEKRLVQLDGLVGAVRPLEDRIEGDEDVEASGNSVDIPFANIDKVVPERSGMIQLALGSKGLVTRRLAREEMQKFRTY